MSGIFRYSGITTKIRAMRASFITKDQYIMIAKMSTVSEVVNCLKETKAYKDVFKDYEAADIHRGQLENMLAFSKYRDFEKIFRFANMEQRRYMKMYFMRYEVAILKKAIIHAYNPEEGGFLKGYENIIGKYRDMDIEKVCNANTIDEIIDSVKGTIFYDTLTMVRSFENATGFDYEIALDLFFFSYIWKKRKKLFKGEELSKISMLYGMEADSLNIMWINRAKRYYNLSSDKVYAMIIPVYYKLKKKNITALVEAEDNEEFLQELSKTRYGKYLKDKDYKGNNIAKICEKYISRCYRRLFKINPYSVSAIEAYLKDKEAEIKKLIQVIECVRYGYSIDDIIRQL